MREAVVPAKSLRVLILENQSFQRAIAVKILCRLGCCQVFEASAGSEAITLLERIGPVDVVVCDVRMEGMDGLEFVHRAARSALIGGVIISSGLSLEVRRAVSRLVTCLDVAFLGDVGKPLHLEALRHALERVRPRTSLLAPSVPQAPAVTAADARRGLSYREFGARYLPRCDLGNGRIKGADVIAHWDHPLHGLLPAAVFMPVLEQAGLLDDLLLALLEHGLELQHEVLAVGPILPLSFSLHLSQLTGRGLTRRIKSLMQCHRSAGQGMGFELAFNGLAEPSVAELESLIRLRMLGCGLCLGSFGSAAGSFQRLCQLPFNEIRVDSLFTHELEHHPRNRAVIRNSLAMADNLGLAVTVTGVESAAQHLMLMNMGCKVGQGSYFAPLLSRDELLRRLSRGGMD